MLFDKLKIKIYRFLKWSEKWTQTDMIYMAKGGFWLSMGQFISMASAFLLSIAFANLLPKETYGVYKYILSIVGLLSIPTLAGMNTAIIQAVAKGYEGSFIPAVKTRIRWGLLSGLSSIILAGYYYINNNTPLTFSFLIIAIFLPFMDPLSSYGPFLNGKKLFKLSTKYNIVTQIIIAVVMALTLYLTNNLFLVILTYVASRTFLRLIILKITVLKLKPNKKESAETISYGKHLTLMGIITLIAEQLDKILIWHYLGAAQLAIYAFAMAPVDQMKGLLLKNIAQLAFPKLSEHNIETIKKTLPIKIKKFLILTIFLAVIYIILAPFIYNTFFPQYLSSIFYSQLAAITMATIPLAIFNTALTAQGQKKKLYYKSTTTSILKIVLIAILLPLYGIVGAIGAIVATQIYGSIAGIYLFKKM